jgi:hypothetical protein
MKRLDHVDMLENKTATSDSAGQPPAGAMRRDGDGCCFVLSGAGEAPRFCDAPAAPGSAYCARHRAVCSVPPRSATGRRLLRRLRRDAGDVAGPPPELAFLASVAVPEPDCGDEAEDLVACLDVAPDRDASDD